MLCVGFVAPSSAQGGGTIGGGTIEGGTASSSTTTTEVTVPTTLLDPDPSTTIDEEPENGSTTSTTQPESSGSTTPQGSDEDEEGDLSDIDLENPLAEEGPTGSVPQTDHTLPDDPDEDDGITGKGRYSGQGKFEPATVLHSSVSEARAKAASARGAYQETIVRIKSLRLRAKKLDIRLDEFDEETQQTVELLEQTRSRLEERALMAFIRKGEDALDVGLDYDEVVDLQVKGVLVGSVLSVDQETVEAYEELKVSLESDVEQILQSSMFVASALELQLAQASEDKAAIEQAERELEAFEAGSAIYIEGVVFPIGDFQYEVPLIDSYGFPRMMGTEDQHWHEGIDIFAPMGAPLIATERGVVSKVGTGKLGGLKVWLHGESGTDWYYAHLSDFAPGLHAGQVVEVGDLLGYVGTSGNAVGTPPHLHMQVHPGGGDAVNPYPLLWVVSQREIQAYEDQRDSDGGSTQPKVDVETSQTSAQIPG